MHSSTVNGKIIALRHLQNSFARNMGIALVNAENTMETDYFEGQFKVDFISQLTEIYGTYEGSIISNISSLISELSSYKRKLEQEEEAARVAARLKRLRELEKLKELEDKKKLPYEAGLYFSE